MNAVYKLIKTDPKADIATELQKARGRVQQDGQVIRVG